MVSGASRSLKLGLRRDITLFLLALVTFLVCIIATLIIGLQTATARAEATVDARRNIVADIVADQLGQADTPAATESVLLRARTRYGADLVELRAAQKASPRPELDDAVVLTRPVRGSTLVLTFDDSALRAQRRTFYLTAIVALVSSLGAALLMILYVPKIVDPFERMIEQARRVEIDGPADDEAAYVIGSFKRTIERLEQKEEELRRMHAEEKSRADELERVSATLTRSLTSGFLSVDPAGRIAELNSAGVEILRLDASSPVIGRPLEEVIAPPLAGALRRSLAENVPLTRIELQQQIAGELVDVGLTTVPLRDADDATLGVLALFTNLTPIHDLERRLREQQTLADLGEMAAGVAHEFRNSLSTILGYVRLARKLGPDAAIEEKLKSAEAEAQQLAAAVTALLGFSRPFTLELREVDLGALAEETASRVADGANDVNIRYDGESATIEADATLIARAIENGVRNAVEAVREKGSGEVHVSVRNGAAPRIVVSDTGAGLDPAEIPRLFLPFQSQRPGGFGLGLSLIRKIVLLHGGSVELTGAPGEGATLTMTFERRSGTP